MDNKQLKTLLIESGCFSDKGKTQIGLFTEAKYSNFMAEQVNNRSSVAWKVAQYIIVEDCEPKNIDILLRQWKIMTGKFRDQYLLVLNKLSSKYDIYNYCGNLLGDDSILPELLKKNKSCSKGKYENLKQQFKDWLSKKPSSSGEQWATDSVNKCLYVLKKGFAKFGGYQEYAELFEIDEIEIYEEYLGYLKEQDNANEFDESEKGWFKKGLVEYKAFLSLLAEKREERLVYIPSRGYAINKIFYVI